MTSLDPPSDRPVVLDVDRDASAFLDLMVDLGHLDDRLLAEVNDRLLDVDTPDGVLHVDDIRRVITQVLFDNAEELDPEFLRVLDQEWPVLFH